MTEFPADDGATLIFETVVYYPAKLVSADANCSNESVLDQLDELAADEVSGYLLVAQYSAGLLRKLPDPTALPDGQHMHPPRSDATRTNCHPGLGSAPEEAIPSISLR
ncbi:hypothetical protein ABIA39_000318 [Nocardia sp. GAS34]